MATNGRIQRDAASDGATDYRPRIATFGGRQTKPPAPHRLRSSTRSESDRHVTLRRSSSLNTSASRMAVFSSTDSLFSSFLPPPLALTSPLSATTTTTTTCSSSNGQQQQQQLLKRRDVVDTESNGMLDYKQAIDATSVDSSTRTRTCTCTRTQQCEPFESWKVLVSCVLTFFLIGFNWVAFPLFYVEFSERFAASKSVLGWVGSLQNAASQIVGLFVSAPVQMYGCRPVAVLGGVVLGVGTALSALSNTVGFLYFSYGIVSGE